jgi:hypothetical protein
LDFAGQLTIGSKWADTENIKKLVETFKDPAVQQFLATDPSVKNIVLPLRGAWRLPLGWQSPLRCVHHERCVGSRSGLGRPLSQLPN